MANTVEMLQINEQWADGKVFAIMRGCYAGVYMSNATTGKRSRSQTRFYLIEPRPNVNAAELADKLIGMETVEEVHLSDGAYGFIVKVRLLKGKAPAKVVNYIRQKVAAKFGTANSQFKYVK